MQSLSGNTYNGFRDFTAMTFDLGWSWVHSCTDQISHYNSNNTNCVSKNNLSSPIISIRYFSMT